MKEPAWIALVLAGSALSGGALGWLGPDEPTRLTFLSVGQGDCAVFQTSGHTILIDVGPKSPTSDAGAKIVLPDLRKLGVRAVDLVLLSHPDLDHIGGLGAVLKGIPVGRVAISAAFDRDQKLLQQLRDAGCRSNEEIWLGARQKAQVGDFSVEVDCPPWHDGEPDNEGSEFVRISGDGASAVLTGDAGAATEAKMMAWRDWSAQVLKLGHHGSRTASSEQFLRSVHPVWAVVSCGRNNIYGHPHQAVLDRARRLGIRVARTDRDGDVAFVLGNGGWERSP